MLKRIVFVFATLGLVLGLAVPSPADTVATQGSSIAAGTPTNRAIVISANNCLLYAQFGDYMGTPYAFLQAGPTSHDVCSAGGTSVALTYVRPDNSLGRVGSCFVYPYPAASQCDIVPDKVQATGPVGYRAFGAEFVVCSNAPYACQRYIFTIL